MRRGRSSHLTISHASRARGSRCSSIRDGALEEVQFKIFEPPRFFEALLRGRHFTEAPDITARICGICPMAYQAGAAAAMEQACGVELTEPIRLLRRLIYCGEWIESHVLHTAMLLMRPTSSATTERSSWRATGATSSSPPCA